MQDKRNRLLRTFSAVFLFAVFNFITSGLGVCGAHFIEYHGMHPEMIGWLGLFVLMGSVCLVLSTGGLLVLSVYVFLSNVVKGWCYIFSATHGILLGLFFLLFGYIIDSTAEDVLSDFLLLLILIAVWVFFTIVSVFSCIYVNSKIVSMKPMS